MELPIFIENYQEANLKSRLFKEYPDVYVLIAQNVGTVFFVTIHENVLSLAKIHYKALVRKGQT